MLLSVDGHFWVFLGLFWGMFLYFFRTVQYFIMRLCIDVLDWHYTVTFNTLFIFFHIISPSAWGHLEYFLETFWPMFLHFLRTIQCFLMKFCTYVLGVTVMVTTPKNFFFLYPPLLGSISGSLWAHILFLENLLIFPYGIVCRCAWCYCDSHYTTLPLSWGPFLGYFWTILGVCSSIT